MQLLMNKGITIVENIISAFLVGTVVAATMFSMVSAQRYTASANHHYQAINIVRDEMENILSGEVVISPGSSYARNVVIDNVINLPGVITVNYSGATFNVDVSATWTEGMWSNVASEERIVAFFP